MKPFSFSLEAVLTLHEREKEVAARAWALAVQAQNRAEEALATGRRELEGYHRMLEQKRSDRFRPSDQQIYLSGIATQKQLCDQLLEDHAKAIQFTKARHVIFLQARVKHEVLIRLRRKKLDAFNSSVRASEEAAVEDLVIVRYSRSTGHV